jgi:hypothetical protein
VPREVYTQPVFLIIPPNSVWNFPDRPVSTSGILRIGAVFFSGKDLKFPKKRQNSRKSWVLCQNLSKFVWNSEDQIPNPSGISPV